MTYFHRTLALSLVLLPVAVCAGEPILSARSHTLREIQSLLGDTEIKGPSNMKAEVFFAKAILGDRTSDYSDFLSKKEMYCLGYALAGRESDLLKLLPDSGDELDEPLYSIAILNSLRGGHQQTASKIIDSPECAPYRTNVLSSNLRYALIRDDQAAVQFLKSRMPQQRIEEIEKLNATKIRRAAFLREFSKSVGAQWLLSCPHDMSFVMGVHEPDQSPVELAAVEIYVAINNRSEASEIAVNTLQELEDYTGLLELYRLRYQGCDRVIEHLSFSTETRHEFQARFASLISCDVNLAATTLSQVQEKYLEDAIIALSAYCRTLEDEEVVALARHIGTEKIRLFFLCSTLDMYFEL